MAAASLLKGAIVAEARSWLGTPYRHQASVKGTGCDCFGLIRGVWRALYGPEPEAVPAYSRDWRVESGKETLIAAGLRHMHSVAINGRQPGDVLIFRMKPGLIATHCGILSAVSEVNVGSEGGLGHFIHAQERGTVNEVPLADWWRRRIVGVFAFPQGIDPPATNRGTD